MMDIFECNNCHMEVSLGGPWQEVKSCSTIWLHLHASDQNAPQECDISVVALNETGGTKNRKYHIKSTKYSYTPGAIQVLFAPLLYLVLQEEKH